MASPKAEERQDGQNDYDETDEIDKSVHETSPCARPMPIHNLPQPAKFQKSGTTCNFGRVQVIRIRDGRSNRQTDRREGRLAEPRLWLRLAACAALAEHESFSAMLAPFEDAAQHPVFGQ